MSYVPRSPDLPIERDRIDRAADALRGAADPVRRTIRAAGFWIAIVLPIAYGPLLAGGLSGVEAALFAGAVAVNVGALVVGHGHDPGEGGSDRAI